MKYLHEKCEKIAKTATRVAGSTTTFIMAILLILGWLASGPYFNFSDSHSLVINTITTICSFVTIFLIQRTQNKDSLALQMKLNELLASQPGASNKLLNIEDLTEGQILQLQKRYRRLAAKTDEDRDPTSVHSIEEIDPLTIQWLVDQKFILEEIKEKE